MKESETDDVRIRRYRSLLPPGILIEDMPIRVDLRNRVDRHRKDISGILRQTDERLLIVVGPCSIHDVDSAKEYAERLAIVEKKISSHVKVVMRVYFEKPRTTIGWKGLINDPNLDQSFEINEGLRRARDLLLFITELNLPVGCEFLDTITPQYIADLVSWGAIGARTTESQVHRELASGLSCVVGFKNGTRGDLMIAVDAIKAASHGHNFLSVTKEGTVAIVETNGNPDCHIILRGSTDGPNYSNLSVKKVCDLLKNSVLCHQVMIDCSHGNSQKDYRKQRYVLNEVVNQYLHDSSAILGLMLESNLVEGNQKLKRLENLVYGQSITDSCIGWTETEEILYEVFERLENR